MQVILSKMATFVYSSTHWKGERLTSFRITIFHIWQPLTKCNTLPVGVTQALAWDQAYSQYGGVAITYRNYTQYFVETNPPVSFVFELVSDDRVASTAGARILQVTTAGH